MSRVIVDPGTDPRVLRDANPELLRPLVDPVLSLARAVVRDPSAVPAGTRLLANALDSMARAGIPPVELERALGAIVRLARASASPVERPLVRRLAAFVRAALRARANQGPGSSA